MKTKRQKTPDVGYVLLKEALRKEIDSADTPPFLVGFFESFLEGIKIREGDEQRRAS